MIFFFLYLLCISAGFVYLIINGFRLSLFNVFFCIFLLFYGPAFFNYTFRYAGGVTRQTTTSCQLLTLFVIFYFLGRIFYTSIQNRNGKRIMDYDKWFDQRPSRFYLNGRLLTFFALATGLFLVLGLFIYGGIDSLKTAFSDQQLDAEALSQLRLDSGVHGWVGPFFMYSVFGISRLIAFLLIGTGFFKKSFLLKCIAYLYSLLIMIALLSNMAKSPFVMFFLQFIVFHLLLFNVKINLKKSVLLSILFFILLIPIYLISTNAGNSGSALNLIIFRIFDEPNRVLNLYPLYYPNIFPFAYGMNIRVIHDLFSTHSFVPANIAVAGGASGVTFNAIFIADAWVDFAYIGVIIQSFVVGLYLSFMDQKIFSKNNFMYKALFASILIGIFSLASGGLIASLFEFGLFSIPLLFYFLKIRFI